ncbi:hypothetical protein AMEX_G8547, partial [Astyanax mexicanus]
MRTRVLTILSFSEGNSKTHLSLESIRSSALKENAYHRFQVGCIGWCKNGLHHEFMLAFLIRVV